MMKTKFIALLAVGVMTTVGCDSGDDGGSDGAVTTVAGTGMGDDGGATTAADTASPDDGVADTMMADVTGDVDTAMDDNSGACDPECPDGEECIAGTCFPAADGPMDSGTDTGGGGPMLGEACEVEGEFCLQTAMSDPACVIGLGCVLSCGMGLNCPDGMVCNPMSVCVYEGPAAMADPGYPDPAAGCPPGTVDLAGTNLMWNVCAPACDGAAPDFVSACPAPGTGNAVGACSLTNGMGSMTACG